MSINTSSIQGETFSTHQMRVQGSMDPSEQQANTSIKSWLKQTTRHRFNNDLIEVKD
jgi:hypothetical protein